MVVLSQTVPKAYTMYAFKNGNITDFSHIGLSQFCFWFFFFIYSSNFGVFFSLNKNFGFTIFFVCGNCNCEYIKCKETK